MCADLREDGPGRRNLQCKGLVTGLRCDGDWRVGEEAER